MGKWLVFRSSALGILPMINRGPLPAPAKPGMTQLQILQDMHGRLHTLEAYVESMHCQMSEMLTERHKLMQTQRALIEHCQRLLHAKETLLGIVGRFVLEGQSRDLVLSGAPLSAEMQADISRAFAEMGH